MRVVGKEELFDGYILSMNSVLIIQSIIPMHNSTVVMGFEVLFDGEVGREDGGFEVEAVLLLGFCFLVENTVKYSVPCIFHFQQECRLVRFWLIGSDSHHLGLYHNYLVLTSTWVGLSK